MGRRRKKKEKKTTNAHHVLFQRKHWTSKKAIYLRRIFVFEVPIEKHNYLHKYVLHDVPIPKDLDSLYEKANNDYFVLKFSNLENSLRWLYSNSEDKLFKECIRHQYEFFFNESI